MIKTIRVENFYSIGKKQEISFEITRSEKRDDSSLEIKDIFVNKVNCIIGSNASGKTNVLKALSFLFWFVNSSYSTKRQENKLPYEPHKLYENEISKIELDFYNAGDFYQYQIHFNKAGVVREVLNKKVVRRTNVFTLERDGDEAKLKTSIDLNKTDEKRFLDRKTVSLLSCLIDTGYLSEIDVFNKFYSNVSMYGAHDHSKFSSFFETSEALYENEDLCNYILSFSEDVDLGIADFKFTDAHIRDPDDPEEEHLSHLLDCVHETSKGSFELQLLNESNGTQLTYSLLSKIYPALTDGGVVLFDEIEAGLHPHVVKKVINLFANKKTNVNDAQLMFSTHQHILMNDRTKTQIFLSEKDENAETEIYRLDDVEDVRNDENYFQKYLSGTYGASPNIEWF